MYESVALELDVCHCDLPQYPPVHAETLCSFTAIDTLLIRTEDGLTVCQTHAIEYQNQLLDAVYGHGDLEADAKLQALQRGTVGNITLPSDLKTCVACRSPTDARGNSDGSKIMGVSFGDGEGRGTVCNNEACVSWWRGLKRTEKVEVKTEVEWLECFTGDDVLPEAQQATDE